MDDLFAPTPSIARAGSPSYTNYVPLVTQFMQTFTQSSVF